MPIKRKSPPFLTMTLSDHHIDTSAPTFLLTSLNSELAIHPSTLWVARRNVAEMPRVSLLLMASNMAPQKGQSINFIHVLVCFRICKRVGHSVLRWISKMLSCLQAGRRYTSTGARWEHGTTTLLHDDMTVMRCILYLLTAFAAFATAYTHFSIIEKRAIGFCS